VTEKETWKQHSPTGAKPGGGISRDSRMLLLSYALLVIGGVGYFTLRGHWSFYLFAHLGALGVIGLLATAAAAIAGRRGHDKGKAWLLAFLLPIITGLIAVAGFRFLGRAGIFYCGGSVSLAVAVLAIISYAIVKRRPGQLSQAK
jgi:hypothetical protein